MRRPEVGIIALALLASACAIPTESPNWDMTWNLPMPDNNGMNIGVASFLPNGVTTVGSPPTAFNASVSAANPINRTLGVDCLNCPNGTAQKPAFVAPLATTTIVLTAGTNLNSGTLATGSQIVLAITNGFTFDPIRPPGGAVGTITFTVDNGGATLGNPLVISGSTSAIPPGQTTTFTMPMTGVLSTASPIVVKMTMDSPAGSAAQPVAMNSSQPFNTTVTPTVNLSSAVVTIAAQPLSSTPTPMDLSGVDTTTARKVVDSATTQGVIFLSVTNPLAVGANATLTFTGTRNVNTPTGTTQQAIAPVAKSVALPAGTAAGTPITVQVPLTGQELRRMIGTNLVATFSGTTAAGTTPVTPSANVTMTTRMQVHIYAREIK